MAEAVRSPGVVPSPQLLRETLPSSHKSSATNAGAAGNGVVKLQRLEEGLDDRQ